MEASGADTEDGAGLTAGMLYDAGPCSNRGCLSMGGLAAMDDDGS